MVKEIDGYKEEQAEKERKREKLENWENWFTIASEIFQKPLYRIVKGNGCLDPSVHVYFEKPNKHLSINDELLLKTDTTNLELYNSLVEKCNRFGGFYTAVDIYPLRGSIEAMCPEVHQNARRLAEELEKRLKVEVSLRTTYPK